MKNGKQINLRDIKVQDVGTTCIMLVSKFSRLINKKHGIVIRLHSPHVLSRVAAYAAATKSAQLKLIYEQIEVEIKKHLEKKHPEINSKVIFKYPEKDSSTATTLQH